MIDVLISGCAAIVFGTLVDCWYTRKVDLQPAEELNPLARWVLRRWGVTGLIEAKLYATIAVVAGLLCAFAVWPMPVTIVAVSVGAGMLGVAGWLWASS